MKKTAILLFVFLLCQSCSLFRTKPAPYPTGVIFPLEKDHELVYEGEIISQIEKKDDLLYFATRIGKVYCVDGAKREIVWKADIPTPLASPPFIGENRLYVSDTESSLYCIDFSGKISYKLTFESEITSGIGANQGQVYFGTAKGRLYCISAESGEDLWHFQAEGSVRSNPVFWQDKIIFGCDDHHVYMLSKDGRPRGKLDVGGRTGRTLSVDGNLLYLGTDDRYLQCVNLKRQKIKWKIRSGGATFLRPVVIGKRVLFLCWNCVLYCLNKKNGTILWWNSIPSRSYYQIAVIDKKVVVSSFSPELVAFDIQTGDGKGRFEASREINSNSLWFSPYLLINVHDPETNTGKLLTLTKQVSAMLTSSKKSPRKQNEEITFRVSDTGFHLPEYEFFLTRFVRARLMPGLFFLLPTEERKSVQIRSTMSTWDWFPEDEGYYRIDVDVTDEREKAQAQIPFLIQERIVDLSLSASMESPQSMGREVVFTAESSGTSQPLYEFRLARLRWVKSPQGLFLLLVEREEIVQAMSDRNIWAWNPGNEGYYLIHVFMQDGQETASSRMVFVIETK
jgi:outer membrane protein assembly factor BamB